MLREDIRKKIKKIVIYTKRVMRSSLVGDYLSAFKGSGLEFEQIREYYMGDDVRFIDWNSSAKANKLMVKQYREERDRTVILLIDVSGSSQYSSAQELRKETIAQVAATLAFVASSNKDRVGALFFSDRVEKWIAPSRGNTQLGKIVDTIFALEPQGRKTNIQEALKFLMSVKKRNAIVFVLSDWIDELDDYATLLRVARCEYDLVGMRFVDRCELELPDIGLLDMQDPETGERVTVDLRKTWRSKKSVHNFLTARIADQKKMFDKYRIDLLDIPVGEPFVNTLISFFHKRIRRQI